GNVYRLVQVANNFSQPNSPTLKCPVTDESYGGSYKLKAGLITADELVLAGESYGIEGDSYLNNSNMPYWTMTPSTFNDNMAGIYDKQEYFAGDAVDSFDDAIRPV